MNLDGNTKTLFQGTNSVVLFLLKCRWTLRFSRDTNSTNRLEERRKAKSAAFYERKKVNRRQLAEAQKTATGEKIKSQLAEYGY